jgi:hypothetical protein
MSQTSVVETLATTDAVLNYLEPTSERPRSYTTNRRRTSRGRTFAMWKSRLRSAMRGRSSVK